MNKKEELKKCYDWWNSLTEERQNEILHEWYPIIRIHEDGNIDKFFGDMPNKYQLEIYRQEHK